MTDLSSWSSARRPYFGVYRSGVSRPHLAAAQRAAAALRSGDTRCCSCITASDATARTIATTGCGWWTRPASWRSRSSFRRRSFPDYLWYHFGNLHDEKRHAEPARAMDLWHRRPAVRGVAGSGADAAPALWAVRPFRRWAVRSPHAVVRLSRSRRRCGQCECRHLRHARPGHRLAVRPRRDRTRCADAAAAAGVPHHRDDRHHDTKTTGRFFPKGPRSMRQGATRHERAHNYVRAGHAAAEALRTRCAWTVINVPGRRP